jgi:hypothetical protein
MCLRSRTHFQWCRVPRVPFSCFPRPDSFRRYRGRRVPFSYFARPYSFSAVLRASRIVLMFFSPGLVFGGTEVVRYRFKFFPLPDMFLGVPRAAGPFFTFCASGLVFGGTEGVGSRFHVLRSRTHFRRYRVHRVPFSCFALSDSFSVVPRASRPVFMFCAPGLVFGDTECIRSRFHVWRLRTLFRRYRGCRVSFSYSTLPDSFIAVRRASGPVLMFCAPELVIGGTEGIRSSFHVLRARTRFRFY